MQKNFDPVEGMNSIKILPGEFYVTKDNEKVETVLGSCVSACVRDPVVGIGGMNHFMLPSDKNATPVKSEAADANRYGNYAMDNLINTILRMGGQKSRLEVKVFGGGRIMSQMSNVGWYNIGFVFDYLHSEGFKAISQDVGDVYPRKIIYYPQTGKVKVRRLNAMNSQGLTDHDLSGLEKANKSFEDSMSLF